MADYELPEDVAQLSDEELESNLSAAVRAFRTASTTTTVTPQTLPNLRKLKASIESLKTEQSERVAAAEAAAAEIDQLTADLFADDEPDVAASAEVTEPVAEVTEPVDGTEEVHVITDVAAAAAPGGARRMSLNLDAVRQRQSGGSSLSRYIQPENPTGVTITASVDVPGFRPGQDFQLSDVAEGMLRRANGLKSAGGGTGLVASYKLPFPDELIVKDGSSAPEGSLAVMRAAEVSRLEGGSLTASGGWCAPSETVYDIAGIACPNMLWDLPEIQLSRGGLRYFQAPILDVAAITWVHTEQDDIAGNTKPCFVIPCPAPTEVRAEAQGICLQVGILTARFFPEMLDVWVRNAMVAHEIRMKTRAYDLARLASTQVTTSVSFAAFSAVYGAVALQAADMIERFNLCDTNLEVVFPWWARNLFLADIARQQGVKLADLDPNLIETAFAKLGVTVQWTRGNTPDVPTNIGNAVAAVQWPADLNFLIYPAGNWQLGRGPEVDLGVIVDSTLMATNDQKIFSEEAVALINRIGISRNVTVTICPNGAVGAQTVEACPTA